MEVVDFEGTSALLELEEAGKLEIIEAEELEKVRELGRRGLTPPRIIRLRIGVKTVD